MFAWPQQKVLCIRLGHQVPAQKKCGNLMAEKAPFGTGRGRSHDVLCLRLCGADCVQSQSFLRCYLMMQCSYCLGTRPLLSGKNWWGFCRASVGSAKDAKSLNRSSGFCGATMNIPDQFVDKMVRDAMDTFFAHAGLCLREVKKNRRRYDGAVWWSNSFSSQIAWPFRKQLEEKSAVAL